MDNENEQESKNRVASSQQRDRINVKGASKILVSKKYLPSEI